MSLAAKRGGEVAVTGSIADITSLRRTVAQKVTKSAGATPSAVEQIIEVLESQTFQQQLTKCVPSSVSYSVPRLVRAVRSMLRRDSRLAACDQMSVLSAVLECAGMGLMPGPLGHIYIAARPKRDQSSGLAYEAVVITGYKGLIVLAKRSGAVKDVCAHIVTDMEIEQNLFELYYEGEKDTLVHRPILYGERGTPVLSYCVLRFKDGTFHVEVSDLEELGRARDRAMESWTGQIADSPWVTSEHDMWKYHAIRKAFKFVDVSVDVVERAINLDDQLMDGAAQSLARWDGNGKPEFDADPLLDDDAHGKRGAAGATAASGTVEMIRDPDDPSAGSDRPATGT